MANTAALLVHLLTIKRSIIEDTNMQVFYSNQLDKNSAKLAVQTKAETKWQKAYDDFMDPSKKINKYGFNYDKDTTRTEAVAEQYAQAAAKEYDEELMLELEELDIQYDTMKSYYDTMLQKENADKDAVEQAVEKAASDTGRLGS